MNTQPLPKDRAPIGKVDGDGNVTFFDPIPEGGALLYAEGLTEAEKLLPHAYLLAKLAMVMPLLEEARDALPAITTTSAKLHGVRLDLGDRMDIAGTYSIDDWAAGS